MPIIGKKSRRGPKVFLLLLLAAIAGAVATSGRDVQRYLKIRSM